MVTETTVEVTVTGATPGEPRLPGGSMTIDRPRAGVVLAGVAILVLCLAPGAALAAVQTNDLRILIPLVLACAVLELAVTPSGDADGRDPVDVVSHGGHCCARRFVDRMGPGNDLT